MYLVSGTTSEIHHNDKTTVVNANVIETISGVNILHVKMYHLKHILMYITYVNNDYNETILGTHNYLISGTTSETHYGNKTTEVNADVKT